MMLRPGVGDIAHPETMWNPTAASKTLDCGLFAGGIFNKACWCLDWPGLCSDESYAAAKALAYPEAVYAPLPVPPVVPAPSGDVLTTPPESGEQAQQTIDELIAQQSAEWKAANQAALAQTAANIEAAKKENVSPLSSISGGTWLVLGAVALGGLLLATRK